ncbi:unnamed protein product [Polarella glacialis]|nr:unnamed protein product [Polarella glacialis]
MVATEVSDGGWRDIYTPTPSSPGRRLLFAWGLRHGYAFETGDVSVAFLHAPLVEKHRVFIIPPKTEGLAEDVLWEAKQSIYGQAISASLWRLLRGRVCKAGVAEVFRRPAALLQQGSGCANRRRTDSTQPCVPLLGAH